MTTSKIFFNQSFDKKRLKALIEWVFKTFGEKEALRVVEDLKRVGFRNATRAGLSLGVHEFTTPPDKPFLVSKAQIAMNMTHSHFGGAHITATERSQRIVDTWHRVSETLRKQVVDYFSTYEKFNPIYIMALSGARGNFSQVRQLVGMRGLMADPQGKIISFPIRSNLREGLTLTEYFISCSGARKGLVDTALRTADTGYLTRRLVDVSHHIVVKRVACDTHKGILVKKLQSNNKTLLSLKDRLIGRVLAEHICCKSKPSTLTFTNQNIHLKIKQNKIDTNTLVNKNSSFNKLTTSDNTILDKTSLQSFENELSELHSDKEAPEKSSDKNEGAVVKVLQKDLETNAFVAKKDQEIYPDLASRISKVRQHVLIRSPLTCAFNDELCQLCYGWSLSQGHLVPLGEAVGVIAAQSIGEPGTQLTMRTFHTGGVFSGDLLQEIRASHSGKVYFSQAVQGLLIRTTHGKIAFLTKTPGEILVVAHSNLNFKTNKQEITSSSIPHKSLFPFQNLSMLFVRQGEHVEKNQLLAEVSDFGDEGNQSIKSQQTVFAELSGKIVEIQGGSLSKNNLDLEEEENEEIQTLHQIEPEKSGKLGLFQILSTGIGATFHPHKRAEQVHLSVANNVLQPTRKRVLSNTKKFKEKQQNYHRWVTLSRSQRLLQRSQPVTTPSSVKSQQAGRQAGLLIAKQSPFSKPHYDNPTLTTFAGLYAKPDQLRWSSKQVKFQGAGVLPFFRASAVKRTRASLSAKQTNMSLNLHQQDRYKSQTVQTDFIESPTLSKNPGRNRASLSERRFEKSTVADKQQQTSFVLCASHTSGEAPLCFLPTSLDCFALLCFALLCLQSKQAKQASKASKQSKQAKQASKAKQAKQSHTALKSTCLFYLRTIAEEGDLVYKDYKSYTSPQR